MIEHHLGQNDSTPNPEAYHLAMMAGNNKQEKWVNCWIPYGFLWLFWY